MALFTRKPGTTGIGVIHHSDQGSQYTSVAFGKRCEEMNVRTSMGTVGDAYDNAMAESFFASLECELIDRRVWKTLTEARMGRCSPGSKVGTTRTGCTPAWATSHPTTLRGNYNKQTASLDRKNTGYPPGASHLWTARSVHWMVQRAVHRQAPWITLHLHHAT